MNMTHKWYRSFMYIMIIMIVLSIAVPVIWVLVASVKEKGEFYGNPWSLPEGLYFQNFIDAFQDANMGQYMLNSVSVTVIALIILLVVAVPAAYALSRFDFKGRKLLNIFFMGGLFINVNYIVVPIFLMLVNGDRTLLHIFPDGFFIDNIFVLAIVYASTTIPFTIYLLTGYFQTIPAIYEEAAIIDGCSHLKTMMSVMIPMARPAINTVILFNFLSYWNDYIISLTLMPGEKKTLQVGLLNLMTAQKAAANYGRLYAGMVIVMVPALILYAIVQKKLIEGMSIGGTKE